MVLTHFERKTLIDYICKTVLMNLLIKKYFIKCNKYRIFKNVKISYIFNKKLNFLLLVTTMAVVTIFRKEESIEILNILGLINNK